MTPILLAFNTDNANVYTNNSSHTRATLRRYRARLEGARRRAHLPRAKARCASLADRSKSLSTPPSTFKSSIQHPHFVKPSHSFSAPPFNIQDEFCRSNAAEGSSSCAHSVRLSPMPEEEHVACIQSADEETSDRCANTDTECDIDTSMSCPRRYSPYQTVH